ncbi:MAG: carbohydrate kinase, partial [Ignavibacteriae bacterium]|nr:carbohydrate kinase [Ignavibacteriota bacterium]
DTSNPEISLETGKTTHAVARQRYSLGGAGNIANNAIALGAASVQAFGVIGGDLFGTEMLRLLAGRSVSTKNMITQEDDFDTPVYAKPHINDKEQERIDFGRFNSLSDNTIQKLTKNLRNALPHMHVLIINQQLVNGVCSERMIGWLNDLARELPDTIMIADSRHRAHLIHRMIRKLNAAEALAENPGGSLQTHIREIAAATRHPVFITRGGEGILACDGSSVYDIPAVSLSGEIDPVGAGDTTVAAIACSLAAGASVQEAAEMGNLAAAVTVQKLRQTGTASTQEIIEIYLNHFLTV